MAKRHFAGKKNPAKAATVEILAYKFRGYPSEEVEAVLWQNINGCRGLWNIMCADAEKQYQTNHTWKLRTPASFKQEPELSWMKELDSSALVRVQMHFDAAMSAFFAKDTGLPVKKRKKRCRASYTTCIANPQSHNLHLEGNMLKLPKVKESVRLNVHRKIRQGGLLKSCTVAREADGWYFSLSYEYPAAVRTPVMNSKPTHIGLDMSLPNLYIDSDGCNPGYQKPFRKSEARLAKLQKRLARKIEANISGYNNVFGKRYPIYKRPIEECRNIQKLIREISLLHARIKHQRNDFLHKQSKQLTDQYDLISIEDLNLRSMGRSLKLGKSVGDAAWGEFTRQLAYKQKRKGHMLIRIDKWFPSSRTCSCCGHIHKELKLSDRTYHCPECGSTMDRDFQAAVNIDGEGLRIYREKQASA